MYPFKSNMYVRAILSTYYSTIIIIQINSLLITIYPYVSIDILLYSLFRKYII